MTGALVLSMYAPSKTSNCLEISMVLLALLFESLYNKQPFLAFWPFATPVLIYITTNTRTHKRTGGAFFIVFLEIKPHSPSSSLSLRFRPL